jgi:hypothetical protein
MLHAIFHFFGFTNASGEPYLFWSGFGSDLAYLSVFGLAYRRLNCHESSCHRLGLHKVEGTPYVTCKKHHPGIPAGPVTAEHIRAAHHRHLRNIAQPDARAGGNTNAH